MGQVSRDPSKITIVIEHPTLGIMAAENFMPPKTAPLSDTTKISDTDPYGNRVADQAKDKGKKITIPVQTNSDLEYYLLNARLYKGKENYFSVTINDRRNASNEIKGTGTNCMILDGERDGAADTNTFEIIALNYSGNY